VFREPLKLLQCYTVASFCSVSQQNSAMVTMDAWAIYPCIRSANLALKSDQDSGTKQEGVGSQICSNELAVSGQNF
jgi:hypothetical protein